MSHELRTPLNAIIGYSEMLEEEIEDLGHGELAPDLQKIRTSGIHLLELINDILDLSKIEAGKLDIYCEEFELTSTLEEICQTSEPLIEKNSNVLTTELPDSPIEMNSDRTKIRQCLFNLISNAAKFTSNGSITLRMFLSGDDDSPRVNILVTDTGIGMSEDQCTNVFDAFTQADESTTRNYGGTGLGLTITKRICEMLGGSISVDSKLDEGTSFHIELPLHVEPRSESAAYDLAHSRDTTPDEAFPKSRTSSPSVLVIDDESTGRELLRRNLIKLGYSVRTANSGEEGLRAARSQKPDLITLDMMMPGMDGWEVLAQLQNDESLVDVPVVIVSMVTDQEMGFAIGATGYLTKPIDKERLRRVLTKHIGPRTSDNAVLVVEDDEDMRIIVGKMLRNEGFEVLEAENGRIGLEILEQQSPKVVLLDLMMPEMDGFTFLRELENLPSARDTPVVVMTAKSLSNEEREELTGLAVKILGKGPADRHQLLDVIRSTIRG